VEFIYFLIRKKHHKEVSAKPRQRMTYKTFLVVINAAE
jgi:hypothetical protein